MEIRNAKKVNEEGTLIDVEIDHPIHGWISYTFNSSEPDESFDDTIRTWLENNTPADYTRDLGKERFKKIVDLRTTIAIDEPVVYGENTFKGGYDSAQKLDAKRRLVLESGGTDVKFADVNDDPVTVTLEEALGICLAVATQYDDRTFDYNAKLKLINAATTLEELDAIVL